MQNLLKPSEYAKRLGISRQAVYAKIKKGILQSKELDGKLYVVVDESKKRETKKTPARNAQAQSKESEALLRAKEETIAVLKQTIADLKESNRQIASTLRSEIELLKEAFNEMRSLYAGRLEHKEEAQEEIVPIEATTEEAEQENETAWLSFKRFAKNEALDKEMRKALKKRFYDACLAGDNRFRLNKNGKLRIASNATFDDLLA